MKIARLHHPVTVLGPGRRLGIWVQGCGIGCAGCMSTDTWDSTAGQSLAIEDLVTYVIAVAAEEGLTGVTVSGGEPFEQADELAALLRQLRAECPSLDLLVYSGFSISVLRKRFSNVLTEAHAVVAGPYIAGQPSEIPWVGSGNQQIVVLDPSVASLYSAALANAELGALQVGVDAEGLWLVGVPRPGVLQQLENNMRVRGVELGETSWRK